MQQDQLLDYLLKIYSENKTPIILAGFAISLAEYEASGPLPPDKFASVILLV
jgi:hypothetical protein